MPLLFAILALACGAYALGARGATQRLAAKVGAARQERPPAYYRGDHVFSLPQRKWGRVECSASASGGGCRYGVRFPNGHATVLGEHEVVR